MTIRLDSEPQRHRDCNPVFGPNQIYFVSFVVFVVTSFIDSFLCHRCFCLLIDAASPLREVAAEPRRQFSN